MKRNVAELILLHEYCGFRDRYDESILEPADFTFYRKAFEAIGTFHREGLQNLFIAIDDIVPATELIEASLQFGGFCPTPDLRRIERGIRKTRIDAVLQDTRLTPAERVAESQRLSEALDRKPTMETVDPIKREAMERYTWGTSGADRLISPFDVNDYVLLLGETGAGKTAYTFDMAIKNARRGARTLYISLEMTTDDIITRIARDHAGIDRESWKNKKLISDYQAIAYSKKKKEIAEIAAFVPHGGKGYTIENIERVIEKTKPDVVFIDNFDLVEVAGKTGSDFDRQERVAKSFMELPKKYGCPVIVLHHFNKGVAKGVRTIHNARGSAKITHNADIVVIATRPNFEGTAEEMAQFLLQEKKSRGFGSNGSARLYFNSGTFDDEYRPRKPFVPVPSPDPDGLEDLPF